MNFEQEDPLSILLKAYYNMLEDEIDGEEPSPIKWTEMSEKPGAANMARANIKIKGDDGTVQNYEDKNYDDPNCDEKICEEKDYDVEL
jgi:hypothetical protein